MARLGSTFSSSTLVNLLNQTMPKIDKTTQDAIRNDSTYLKIMEANGGVVKDVTGEDLTWPIEMAKNDSFGARTWASAIPLRMQDINRVASEPFSEYTIAVTLDQLTINKNGSDDVKIVNYAMSQISNMRYTMIDGVNQALQTGSGTYPSANGLSTLIPETVSSGTLHGIDRATSTWWRNQSTASTCNTTNAFGPVCMLEIDRACKLASGGQGKSVFKIGMTDDATHANMCYYLPNTANQVPQIIVDAGGVKNFTPPMKSEEPPVYLRSATIYWDHAAIADAMRFFSPEYVKVRFVKDSYFKITPEQMAEDSFSVRILMGCAFQHINMNPRRSAVLYNFNS